MFDENLKHFAHFTREKVARKYLDSQVSFVKPLTYKFLFCEYWTEKYQIRKTCDILLFGMMNKMTSFCNLHLTRCIDILPCNFFK